MSGGAKPETKVLNEAQVNWSFAYLFLGFMILALFCLSKCSGLQDFFKLKLSFILWSASWAAVGIGLCLWNSRHREEKENQGNWHYATYFAFILFFTTIAAVAFSEDVTEIQVYLKALVIALGIGFSGEKLQARFK